MLRTLSLSVLLAAFATPSLAQSPLKTRWTDSVTVTNVHREYPRMQMRRERWRSLNGSWQYAVRPREAAMPTEWDGEILVPFPIESTLSQVGKRVTPDQRLWYRRTFHLPNWDEDTRKLLHFGAVDWHCEVWLDGTRLGDHRGGYVPFSFDATLALHDPGRAEHELVVAVWDPTDRGPQARGKQTLRPHGIWYTPTTGIWQSVWMEPVPRRGHIESLWTAGDPKTGEVTVRAGVHEDRPGLTLRVTASRRGTELATAIVAPAPASANLVIPNPRPWTPDEPWLYDLRIELVEGQRVLDTVDSYVGLRTVSVQTADDGHRRLFLNGEPLFHYGVLDQGFWPDGLYTPPCDAAIEFDLRALKRLGFNMLRKHVKVESDRFYYWCDKLGLLVWQDMPSGDGRIGHNDPDPDRPPLFAFDFERELRAMIEAFRGHPCIVMWVPFNEGWTQYDTARIAKWVAELDPTRLVNSVSGWADRGVGDVHDIHSYPGPAMPPVESKRAAVLGEFGGLGLPLTGHTWQDEKNWGYRSYADSEKLTDAYVALIERTRWLIGEGLAAAVYTQLSDVEIEVNGLLTYDREVVKMDEARVLAANEKLYLPPPTLEVVVPTSRKTPQRWLFTTKKPAEDWHQASFDAASWMQGRGSFGTKVTPGATIGTTWDGSDIWLRRTFDLPADRPEGELQLRIFHDEDAEVWINGVLAARLETYTTGYVLAPITKEARAALKATGNVIAVHCRQTRGGQCIDVGVVAVRE